MMSDEGLCYYLPAYRVHSRISLASLREITIFYLISARKLRFLLALGGGGSYDLSTKKIELLCDIEAV